jgi:hypothetical protein
MHPEVGMGVEFMRTTDQQHEHLRTFIHALKNNHGEQPEFMVEPEGMGDVEPVSSKPRTLDGVEDPLLKLFQRSNEFTPDSFLSQLRAQGNPSPADMRGAASG